MKYYVPKSIKLINGSFSWDETVTLSVDGKIIKRKVRYTSLDGLHVVIDNCKYGRTDLDKN